MVSPVGSEGQGPYNTITTITLLLIIIVAERVRTSAAFHRPVACPSVNVPALGGPTVSRSCANAVQDDTVIDRRKPAVVSIFFFFLTISLGFFYSYPPRPPTSFVRQRHPQAFSAAIKRSVFGGTRRGRRTDGVWAGVEVSIGINTYANAGPANEKFVLAYTKYYFCFPNLLSVFACFNVVHAITNKTISYCSREYECRPPCVERVDHCLPYVI